MMHLRLVKPGLLDRFQAPLRQRRGDVHAVLRRTPLVGGFVAGVAGGGVDAVGFGAVHRQRRRLAPAADGKAGAALSPLGERRTNDGFVGGGAGDILEGEFGLQRDGDLGNESARAQGQEFTDI